MENRARARGGDPAWDGGRDKSGLQHRMEGVKVRDADALVIELQRLARIRTIEKRSRLAFLRKS
ncbi:MAG TPA: hypothetical protein VE669_08940 [Actinomycetota bacterium]|nr:hypothetical protein [Actinomycetota bacterium]